MTAKVKDPAINSYDIKAKCRSTEISENAKSPEMASLNWFRILRCREASSSRVTSDPTLRYLKEKNVFSQFSQC